MRLFILGLLVSLNLYAAGPVTIIPTQEVDAVVSIPGTVLSVSPHIDKLANGSLGIQITIAYRSFGRTIKRHVFSFPLSERVSFVQKGKDLFITHQGQETLLAHHEWWYSPFWNISNKNVQIKANLEKLGGNKFLLNPQIVISE